MIAGITVGLTMMPQSIAYASIAELPPHYGLYTAIMGSFVYIFFGTVKQVSIGPSSLMSVMTYSYLGSKGMDYIILLSFMAGCVEFLMGVLNLGFLVDFISAPVTSGFTSATSVIIILAQLKNLFGLKFKSAGVFNLIKKLLLNIKDFKTSDTLLGLFSMVFLLIVKRISQIKFKNEKINKAMWYLAICRNALIVFTGSIIAFIFERNTGHQPFYIAGKITPGLPTFSLPNFSTTSGNQTVEFTEMMSTLGTSIFVIPIVAVLANVAIAKTFADGSVFNASQEMMTLGIANIMGSFVGSMPTTGAFTRSAVNDASNVQTPMGGFYVGTMILLALSFLTPYFYFIPKATIAAVLICAVMFMIEYSEVPKLWKCNKFDCFVGVLTFVASLIYGIEEGLMVGILLNMIVLLKLWARPHIYSELRANGKNNDYLLVKPELGIFFPGSNHLMETLINLSDKHKEVPIILDLKNVIRVDYTACQTLVIIIKAFAKKTQQLVFINVNPAVYQNLKSITETGNLNIRDTVREVYDHIFEEKTASGAETPLLQSNIIIYNEATAGNEKRQSFYENA